MRRAVPRLNQALEFFAGQDHSQAQRNRAGPKLQTPNVWWRLLMSSPTRSGKEFKDRLAEAVAHDVEGAFLGFAAQSGQDARASTKELFWVIGDPLSLTIPDPDHSQAEDRSIILGESHRRKLS